MRDLTYVGSGASILLTTIAILVSEQMIQFDFDVKTPPVSVVIASMAISYVVGFLLNESVVRSGLMLTVPSSLDEPYAVTMDDIEKNRHPNTLLRIERINYLKHFGSTFGSASLVLLAILLVYMIFLAGNGRSFNIWWPLVVVEVLLLGAFFACKELNHRMTSLQFDIVERLRSRFETSAEQRSME